MTNNEFLAFVQSYVEEHPTVAAYISNYVAYGIEASRLQAQHRAADMEAALAMALMKRDKGTSDRLILAKLQKWQGKSSLEWSRQIEAMEKLAAQKSLLGSQPLQAI